MEELIIFPLLIIVFVILYREFSKDSDNNDNPDKFDENGYYKGDKDYWHPNGKNKKKYRYTSNLFPYFVSIIGMLTKISKSDGVISKEEADVIIKAITNSVDIISKELKVSAAELSEIRKQLVQAHKNAKKDNVPISTYALYLARQKINFKANVMNELISIAVLDGYNSKKEILIYEAGSTLGFTNSQIKIYIKNIVGEPNEDPENISYEILRCKVTDDNATIKKKYRTLIKKYHPDFIQTKDLDEDFIEFAKQKMQEINFAYDVVKKERGL